MAKAKILVVDDEPHVLRVVASMLDRAGYEATAEPDPLRALEIVAKTEKFDVVLSDVVMPGMRGPELAERIRLVSPWSQIILMSSYVPANELPRGIPFLGKPFSLDDLTRAVAKALKKVGGKRALPPIALSAGSK